MGRFQRSAGTHLHAGRDAAFHGALAGAHGAFFAPAVAVSLQVHTSYKTLPHPAALLGALHINKAVHRPGEHVLGVVLHGGVDLFHPRDVYKRQGYALLLLVVGVVREWLSLGPVFGAPVGRWALLPLAKMPAGGFLVLGILCAIWRAAAATVSYTHLSGARPMPCMTTGLFRNTRS